MSNEYIDIDSTYRNRKIWPLPGQFEIQISQTGDRQKGNALDPISLAEPLKVWSCNGLTTTQPTTFQIYGEISPPRTYGNFGYSQSGYNLSLVFTDIYNSGIQTTLNYYAGLVIWNVRNTEFSRIISYRYIGTDSKNFSYALIQTDTELPFIFGDNFVITDSSDLSKTEYPLLFVPNGALQNDAYLNSFLYCETNNDYKKITFYDSLYKYVSSEPWNFDNFELIQSYGNFCIRKEVPLFPTRLENSQFISTTSTLSNIVINVTGTCSLNINNNHYRNDFLRIRPYRDITPQPLLYAGGIRPNRENILISTNGVFWAEEGSDSNLSKINSMANDTQGQILTLIAVGYDDITGNNIVSYNGTSWVTITTSPFINECNKVLYFEGYWFVSSSSTMAGEISFAMTTDFITWTNTTNPLGFPFNAGAGTGIGGEIYGIEVIRSRLFPDKFQINVVGRSANVSIVNMMIGYFDPLIPGPITWFPATGATTIFPYNQGGIGFDVKSNGAMFVTVGTSPGDDTTQGIYYSNGGIEWYPSVDTVADPNNLTNPFRRGAGKCIGWNGSYFLAGGILFDEYLMVAKSYDGINWTIVQDPTNKFRGIPGSVNSLSWQGSFWVAFTTVSAYGDFNSSIGTSPDGDNWTPIDNNAEYDLLCSTVVHIIDYVNTGIYSNTLISQTREIIFYKYEGTTITFEVYPPFTGDETLFSNPEIYTIEVEGFSYDNSVPFTYTGTLVQQASCYEFELVNLILPNFTLSSGKGSKIAFYPYVYVELSNVSSSSGRTTNILRTNNPNAVGMLFKIPIYDVQDPVSTPFVRLVEGNMVQTIKFKPDDNLYFTVLLPNGDIFNTLLIETFSPEIPNEESQISATFRYRRII